MSDKGKKLRPIRIFLAIMTIILFIIILDRLPTSRKRTDIETNYETTDIATLEKQQDSDGIFIYPTGLIDYIENTTEERLDQLGVPEEEYSNISEYFSKQEIYELEQQASLATKLEGGCFYADNSDIVKLKQIFSEELVNSFSATKTLPKENSEYQNLSELLGEYEKELTTTEEYDETEV